MVADIARRRLHASAPPITKVDADAMVAILEDMLPAAKSLVGVG